MSEPVSEKANIIVLQDAEDEKAVLCNVDEERTFGPVIENIPEYDVSASVVATAFLDFLEDYLSDVSIQVSDISEEALQRLFDSIFIPEYESEF